MTPTRSGFTSAEELEWKVRRIEAVAQALFRAEYPDGSWDNELRLLDTPKRHYSLVVRYRQMADVAIATVRDFGEYTSS